MGRCIAFVVKVHSWKPDCRNKPSRGPHMRSWWLDVPEAGCHKGYCGLQTLYTFNWVSVWVKTNTVLSVGAKSWLYTPVKWWIPCPVTRFNTDTSTRKPGIVAIHLWFYSDHWNTTLPQCQTVVSRINTVGRNVLLCHIAGKTFSSLETFE